MSRAPTSRPSRVLVLGASGFLGANVVMGARRSGHEVVAHTASSPAPAGVPTVVEDLSVPDGIGHLIGMTSPDLVVNCAALADVDRCEREPDLSAALNIELPRRLAEVCAARGTELIHVSTDAVYGGVGGPFTPDDPPRPINTYGRHKAAGEEQVSALHGGAIVARTNIVGWSPSGRRSLLEYFHDRLTGGVEAPGFTDILFRPLPVQWFWPACEVLRSVGSSGLQHVTGPELLSKHAFGVRVAAVFGLDPSLITEASGLRDGRPAARAAVLDVRPSMLPSGEPLVPGTLDEGLAELRDDAERGLRVELSTTRGNA